MSKTLANQYHEALGDTHIKYLEAIKEILLKKDFPKEIQTEISMIFNNINTRVSETGFWVSQLEKFLV